MTFAMLSVVCGTDLPQDDSLRCDPHNLPASQRLRATLDAIPVGLAGQPLSDLEEVTVREWRQYLGPYISPENPEELYFDSATIEVPLYLGSVRYRARLHDDYGYYARFYKLDLSVKQQSGEVVFGVSRGPLMDLLELVQSEAAATEPTLIDMGVLNCIERRNLAREELNFSQLTATEQRNRLPPTRPHIFTEVQKRIQINTPFAQTLRETLNQKARAVHIPPLFEPGMDPLGTGHTPEVILLILSEAKVMHSKPFRVQKLDFGLDGVGLRLDGWDSGSSLSLVWGKELEDYGRVRWDTSKDCWISEKQERAYLSKYSFNIRAYCMWSNLEDANPVELKDLRERCNLPHILRDYMERCKLPEADWAEAEAYVAELRADYEARNRDQTDPNILNLPWEESDSE